MLFLRKTTLAAGLIGATMAGGLALAAVDGVPNFNVEPSCRAAAQQAASPEYRRSAAMPSRRPTTRCSGSGRN